MTHIMTSKNRLEITRNKKVIAKKRVAF